jgi:hypothetical protein
LFPVSAAFEGWRGVVFRYAFMLLFVLGVTRRCI